MLLKHINAGFVLLSLTTLRAQRSLPVLFQLICFTVLVSVLHFSHFSVRTCSKCTARMHS